MYICIYMYVQPISLGLTIEVSPKRKLKAQSSKAIYFFPVASRRGKKFSCGDTVEIRFEALSRISTVAPHEKFFPRRDPTGKLNFELLTLPKEIFSELSQIQQLRVECAQIPSRGVLLLQALEKDY